MREDKERKSTKKSPGGGENNKRKIKREFRGKE